MTGVMDFFKGGRSSLSEGICRGSKGFPSDDLLQNIFSEYVS